MKTAKIGAGCWNGPGGGIEEGETPGMAARRELWEEFGLEVDDYRLVHAAKLWFHNNPEGKPPYVCGVHVFLAWGCRGEPVAQPGQNIERPTWFPVENLPEPLMPADPYWLPRVFGCKLIEATFHYGPGQKELLFPPGYDLASAVRPVGLIHSP
jgi:8-oxo-dGTP pyrophosphatase MutT (NUDIX family)